MTASLSMRNRQPAVESIAALLAVNFREVVHSAGRRTLTSPKQSGMDIDKNAPLTPKVERPWCDL